jgi:hypothetical protein
MPINQDKDPRLTIIRYRWRYLTPWQKWRVIGLIYWVIWRDKLRARLAR